MADSGSSADPPNKLDGVATQIPYVLINSETNLLIL